MPLGPRAKRLLGWKTVEIKGREKKTEPVQNEDKNAGATRALVEKNRETLKGFREARNMAIEDGVQLPSLKKKK